MRNMLIWPGSCRFPDCYHDNCLGLRKSQTKWEQNLRYGKKKEKDKWLELEEEQDFHFAAFLQHGGLGHQRAKSVVLTSGFCLNDGCRSQLPNSSLSVIFSFCPSFVCRDSNIIPQMKGINVCAYVSWLIKHSIVSCHAKLTVSWKRHHYSWSSI